MRAWVLVLGDVGRSPRMQYHALSLCRTAAYDEVCLVGYRGSALIADLQQHEQTGRLRLCYIPDLPAWLGRLPGVLRLLFKAVAQLAVLLYMLLYSLPRPDVLLLQLPPALPTMLVCWLAAARHRARLVFDWHNFAYTLMALGLGRRHPLVLVAERYERFWARQASASLCVTRAMQSELLRQWHVEATVFYDRPPDFFRPASLQEKHDLLVRLADELARPMHPRDFAAEMMRADADAAADSGQATTLCTTFSGGSGPALRVDRPAVVVSSTSWTPDEDFGLLLAAAQAYDAKARRSRRPHPRVLFLVTGKGPQREQYEERMRGMDLQHVAFRTLWLAPGDYPLLLGSADLGVSLHASSSGLDLPMKVVDMFGCGLPVCALSYSCIGELVSHGANGLLFSTADELAGQLADVLRGFPRGAADGPLATMQRGVVASGMASWHDSWQKVVAPVLAGAVAGAAGGGSGKRGGAGGKPAR